MVAEKRLTAEKSSFYADIATDTWTIATVRPTARPAKTHRPKVKANSAAAF